MKIFQKTKTDNEFLIPRVVRKSSASTVTSVTPKLTLPRDPAALAVGGTAATGTLATVQGGDGDVLWEDSWNVITGGWEMLDIPEGRFWVPQGGIIAIGLETATDPAASMVIGASLKFGEYSA